ncbi:30S ribosomal protein S13 [Patescibacteria group bacterium]|nr:30S ribosomal protein S13 [Patescibacteria group bacterium]
MPRLAGVNIPDKKQIKVALTYIYGIGEAASVKILQQAKINPQKEAGELKTEELSILRDIIEKGFKIEGSLRREVMLNIKRLRDIGSWRGLRHQKRLPVRGQRTSTNTRTVRGNVTKTVGSGKKPAASPT